MKYRSNPSKALFELKNLTNSSSKKGIYFAFISDILSSRIEDSLRHIQMFNSTNKNTFPL